MVAVRSSATAEDLPFASFAGQQDTYLGVLGADAVVDAVRRCWASLWTDRAVSYRASQGIDHAAVRLAVVVQTMIHSEVAGVLFTANPVTGRRREAVIDASPGLGEAVVSGAVTPDHVVVDTATRRILDTHTGDKRFAIHALPGGGTEQVPLAAHDGICLTDRQITELAGLGDRVETQTAHRRTSNGPSMPTAHLWLTQARPITTLYPLPDAAHRQGLRVFLCFSVAQGLYRPLTPMGLAAFRLLASSVAHTLGAPESADPLAGPPAYAEAGQRVFLDLTGILRSRVGRALMPRVLDLMETRSATVLRGLFDRPEFSIVRTSPRPALRRAARLAVRYRAPVRLVQAIISPAAAHRRVDDTCAARAGPTLPGATPAERLDHVERILFLEVAPRIPEIIPGALGGLAMFGLAARLLRSISEPGDLQVSLKGLPHNITTAMDLELWSLTQRVRADPAAAAALRATTTADLAGRYASGDLPPALQAGLAGFLARYGHRAVAEIDVGLPRWSDDPSHLLGVLANYLRLENPDLAPDLVFDRSAREAEQLVQQLAARAGRLRGPIVRFALGRARRLIGIREMPKNIVILALAAVRRNLLAVGEALAAEGLIDDARDIVWLSIAEARAGLAGGSLQQLVGPRRESYDREMRRRRVPRVLLSDGTEPEAVGAPEAATEAGDLAGVAASPGSVTGTVRVILDPRRPARTRGDPGRTVDGSRLDPVVPHRRWIGDGDGRAEFARRGGRPGVRNTRGGRGPAGHRQAVDR